MSRCNTGFEAFSPIATKAKNTINLRKLTATTRKRTSHGKRMRESQETSVLLWLLIGRKIASDYFNQSHSTVNEIKTFDNQLKPPNSNTRRIGNVVTINFNFVISNLK